MAARMARMPGRRWTPAPTPSSSARPSSNRPTIGRPSRRCVTARCAGLEPGAWSKACTISTVARASYCSGHLVPTNTDALRKAISRPSPLTSGRLLVCGRCQRDGRLGREQQERQRLLEVETHDAVGVTQIADRDVLPDVQIEIAASRGEHEGTGDGRGPDDLVLDEFSDMLQHGIPVVTGLSEGRISIGAEQH